MTDNKAIKPYPSMLAPAQARQDLRRDLTRWLAYPPNPRPMAGTPDIDANSLLDLCFHYRAVFAGAEPNLAAAWNKRRSSAGSPTFNKLVSKGWVVFDGCRWAFPPLPSRGASDVVYPNDETRDFLHGLGKATPQPAHRGLSPAADALAQEFKDGKRDLETVGWRGDADWIASRIWQMLCPPAGSGEAAVDVAFADWCAWCLVLHVGGKWDLDWNDVQALHCRDAAWRVLDRQTQWGVWGQGSERYVQVLTKTMGIPSGYVSHPSREDDGTMVERVQSLRDPGLRHLTEGRLRSSAAGFALSVLRSELERTDMSLGQLLTSAAKFASFVTSRPMAFIEVVSWLAQHPKLLADLLMQPAAASAATMLITEWLPSTSSWNRALSSQREDVVKRFAVQDALAVVAHHLKGNQKELRELAALVTWCYAEALGIGPAANSAMRHSAGRQLLATVGEQLPEIQAEFFQHLVAQASMRRNVRFALFGGVLDALDCLPDAPQDLASPLVPLYATFARAKELTRTDIAQLPHAAVVRLVSLALRQAAPEKSPLLYPIDLPAQLKGAKAKDRPAVLMGFSDVLRTHVRMLARAVAYWPGDSIPPVLAVALQEWVWQTCVDQPKNARVGALTSRYSAMRFFAREAGSPAEDLAAAWRRLDNTGQAELLRALQDTEDPVLLAELCRHLPSTARQSLRYRLLSMTPDRASQPSTWVELEQRAAALIEAGELSLGEVFLKEATTDDEHAPEAVRLKTFSLGLQLLIKKKAWADLDAAAVPARFSNLLKDQASELLTFYRASSQMLRPGGNLAAARQALATLSSKTNAPPTYRENFYAAAIQELIGPAKSSLPEADRPNGERILAEIDADIAAAGSDLSRTRVLAEHRALLLIALERPQEAIDTLTPYRAGRSSQQSELVAAIARAAMGFEDQAADILDRAIDEFGQEPDLLNARQGIRQETRAAVTPAPSLVVDDLTAAKLAMQSLTRLQPEQLGDVLGPPGLGFRGFMTDIVSRAVTSLQHLAPVLRDSDANDEKKLEDDLNTAVREILDSSLRFVGWVAKDQSLGGAIRSAKPGERDAVICSGNRELSIYEALVCGGVNRKTTTEHFHKVLGYGTVDIYFLVIYAFAADINPLLESVEEIARVSLPSHTVLDTIKPLGLPNYETRGFLANYKIDRREAAVVFLVADLAQGALKIAHAAPATAPAPKRMKAAAKAPMPAKKLT